MAVRARTMFGSIGAIASAGLLAGVLLATSGSAASAASGTHQAPRAESVQQGVLSPRLPAGHRGWSRSYCCRSTMISMR